MNVCKPLRICFLRGFLLAALFLFLCTNSCAKPQIQNDFYKGLSGSNSAHSFEKALSDPNEYVRRAAAEELAGLMYQGTALSVKTAERVRREAAGAWAAAFDAVEKIQDKGNALAFLLNFEDAGTAAAVPILYTLREFEKQGSAFNETELAAIDGHLAILRLRYNEALALFRKFMEDDVWPERIPQMFLKYPVLINDLGKAFQYTSSGSEGLNLFLQWETKLEKISGEDDLRYKLLFFAARIARRRGLNEQALSLFERARPLAPASEQMDACIWYILDLSVNGSYELFIKRLEQLVPHWRRDYYFDDILEKLLQTLVSKKEWEKIIRIFDVIKTNGTASTAGYAWVIARTLEEGYLSAGETQLAAIVARETQAAPAAFFRRAYDAGNSCDSSSLYYRSLSAAALGLPFLELPSAKQSAPAAGGKHSPALQFILGFFGNNAPAHSVKFIKTLEKDLSADELRVVAQSLAKAGMYAHSIRLVSGYVNREGYNFTRDDLELLFPRPYQELAEKYAAEHSIALALMFGLIRTESAFESAIVSRAGAVGLTQIMPETAKEMAGRIRRAGGPDYVDENKNIALDDPELNIHIGSFYLNYLTGRFDDILISLMAYNGGINRVRRLRSANKIPSDLFLETISIYETRNYGRKVMAAAAVYEELYYR